MCTAPVFSSCHNCRRWLTAKESQNENALFTEACHRNAGFLEKRLMRLNLQQATDGAHLEMANLERKRYSDIARFILTLYFFPPGKSSSSAASTPVLPELLDEDAALLHPVYQYFLPSEKKQLLVCHLSDILTQDRPLTSNISCPIGTSS